MTARLHRFHQTGHLHFITFSCYQRRTLLDDPTLRDLLLQVLEQVRRSYRFVVAGYVVMPEHVHLLIDEPERANTSTVMQVLKQRFARRILRIWRTREGVTPTRVLDQKFGEAHVWQPRFYDFVVWREGKRGEKLRYIHRNPVQRGLVTEPDQWKWSSFRHYAYGEPGPVLVNEQKPAELKFRGETIDLAAS